MICTVTNQGKTRLMGVEDAFDSDKLIELPAAPVKDAGREVCLILDDRRVHHGKPVKAWLAERLDTIEVFYLPSCSRALNPDERLNTDLKCAGS